jgi:hypothetical protein
MQISNIRILGICLAIGLALGLVGGAIYALAADKVLAHGIGTGLLVVGLIALALGLLGATEPPEGWSLKRRIQEVEEMPRRSFAARAAYDHPSIDNKVSSVSLAVWGIVVGGGLIALSMLAFKVAAS